MVLRQSLQSKVAEVPPSVQNSVKKGFASLAGMSYAQRMDFVDKIINVSLDGRPILDLSSISEQFGIDPASARNATNALSVLVGLAPESEGDVDEFMRISDEKLYSREQYGDVKQIVSTIFKRRHDIQRSLERASLASETLPSLRSIALTVDLRPKFEDAKIVDVVPIALAHIDTDSEPEIWLQLTQADIRYIIEALRKASSEMEVAEGLFHRPTGTNQ